MTRDIYNCENLLNDHRAVPLRFIYIASTNGYAKLIVLSRKCGYMNFADMLMGFKAAVLHSYGAAVMFRAGLFHSYIQMKETGQEINSQWNTAMDSLFKNFLFFKTPRGGVPLQYVRKDRPKLTEEQLEKVQEFSKYKNSSWVKEVLTEGIKAVPVAASYLAGGYDIEHYGGAGMIPRINNDLEI